MMKIILRIIPAVVFLLLGSGSLIADEVDVSSVQNLAPYYQKDGAELGSYDKVLIDTLATRNARVIAPPWIEGDARNPKKWQLTNADIDWLRKSYQAAMKEQIEGNGGYEIVSTPGEGVVILDVRLISLMPYARRGEKVTVRGFGELVVQAQLRDGLTGELLAVYEGPQEVGLEYQQNTRLNSEQSLSGLFSIWGARMRMLLDRGRKN